MSGEKGDPNRKGNSRRWIVREVEDSLRRLQTDWIDLYQVHRWDYGTAHEETLSALTDLRTQGKIRAFGCSTYPAHETVEARWTAERLGLGHYATEQPPYSILFRGIEADILPVAGKYEMGVIPWSPLAGGWLTGRSRGEGEQTPRQKMMSRALRHVAAQQPAQGRGGRPAGAGGRGGGPVDDPHGAGLRAGPPGGDRAHHRAPDDGPPGEPARAPPR